MENKFTYSIIIPHKNIPKLLQRCLDSIPIRDDVEVIVVDDNSDPSVVDFGHFPGQDRPNTTIIFDKSGKGAGRARNIGLEHATGKWLLFADADDYFYDGFLYLLDEYANSDYDIIYFYCNSRDGESGELIKDRVENILIGIKNQDKDLLRYNTYVPWGKLISNNIVNKYGIKFEEVIASNDVMFSTLVGYFSKSIGYISTPLYCCTYNRGSLAASSDITKIRSRLYAAIRVNDFMIAHKINKRYYIPTMNYTFYFFPNEFVFFLKSIRLCKKYYDSTMFWMTFFLNLKCRCNTILYKVIKFW